MRKIRVLIVDDSTVVRRILTDVLATDIEIEVVGTAATGRIALQKLPQLTPDVVTMDIEMPDLDGVNTVRELRKSYPKLPVIMFSTLTERGAVATLDALSAGANDYVTKPANVGSVVAAMESVRSALIPKIKALCAWKQPVQAPRTALASTPLVAPPILTRPRLTNIRPTIEVVVIGSSTGGPNALAEVLPKLPADFPVPIVIVQHMPPVFTMHLARRLDQSCALHVQEGRANEPLRTGDIWIAPGDFHLLMSRQGTEVMLRTNQNPPENSCRPAVDVLFRSAAEVYGPNVLSVVLTGMGSDGTQGCSVIRSQGGRVIAQDEATSVVWGMPGSVINAGLADIVCPLAQVAEKIIAETTMSRTRKGALV